MIAERIEAATRVDWWPFIRLVITAAALGLGAQFLLGWQIRLSEILVSLGQMFGVLSILAMVSFVLADLYLLIFLLAPLYLLALLNDWTYAAGCWACRMVFRPASKLSLALGGLTGEVLLFGGLVYLLLRSVR